MARIGAFELGLHEGQVHPRGEDGFPVALARHGEVSWAISN